MREKRKYQRAELSTEVTVSAADGLTFTTQSRDVGLGGIFLVGPMRVPIGTQVSLRFELPVQGPLSVPAFVRWSTGRGFGLQFGLLGARETHALVDFVRSCGVPVPAE